MDTRMTRAEREAFLAEPHVGVLSIPRREGTAPLTAPIWYAYEPGGELWLITGRSSRKGRLLQPGIGVALCAQEEAAPYRYVSVEGRITALRDADLEQDLRPMARRYLGPRGGDRYADDNGVAGSMRVTIEVQRWLTVDYHKLRKAYKPRQS